MNMFLWFMLLALQNASFTWVSRARNSGSYSYHAVAATFSNGIWFVSQLFLISMVVRPGMPTTELVKLGAIYILGSVTGSVCMHWISKNFLEKGNRVVGG